MSNKIHDFPPLKNDAILKVACGQKPHRIPIWIMRQAGRYLPEFLEIRKHHDFFELVNNPELAAEVTLQPIRRFDLDASIIFSDILVIPQALGLEVLMKPGVGPVLPEPLREPEDLKRLNFEVDVSLKTKGTLDAITLTRKKLEGKVPLFGFTGAPWTLMSYMIEGGGSKTCHKAKAWLYKYPKESQQLLENIGEVVIQYLVLQVKAGAQLLQVFESHAEFLSPDSFAKYCLPILRKIVTETNARLTSQGVATVPMVVFAKGGHYAINELSKSGYNVVGLDWTIDPKVGRQLAEPGTVLQGNMDPVALFGDTETVKATAKAMIEKFGSENYICNLGHGIYPETPVDSVQAFIETVHSFQL